MSEYLNQLEEELETAWLAGEISHAEALAMLAEAEGSAK